MLTRWISWSIFSPDGRERSSIENYWRREGSTDGDGVEGLGGTLVHEPGGKLTGRQWQLTPRVNLYTPSVLPEAVALFDV